MVSPVSDSSEPLIGPSHDSLKHKDPSHEKGGSSQINVFLSEKAQELKMFESDSPLIEMLKKEFNEVFEFLGDDKKASFLKKLDHILVNKRV